MKATSRVERGAVAACLACAALAVQAGPVPSDPVATDVLDLRQAATLMRVSPQTVVRLAQAGQIPARRVGKEWRFNRVALMEWLQGDRYAFAEVTRQAALAERPETASLPALTIEGEGLAALELAALTGRGPGGGEAPRLAQGPAASPPTSPASAVETGTAVVPASVGARPSGLTAEEVALRQRGAALVPEGSMTIEGALAYSRQVREGFPVLRVEEDTATATLTGRYGIQDDLQVSASLPMNVRRTEVFTDTRVSPDAPSRESRSESYAGDLALSLLGVALREGTGRPNVLLSLDAVLPTGPGDVGVGGGVVISKSYDPVVVLAGLNYLYGVAIDPIDPRAVLARHNIGFNLGYAYAINDTIALSGQFAGTYRTPREGPLPPEKESYLVQLGLTWQLGRDLFIEPSVAVGVGGAAPDFSFTLNVPYTF